MAPPLRARLLGGARHKTWARCRCRHLASSSASSGQGTFQAFPMGLYEQPPAGLTAEPPRSFGSRRSLTAAQIRGTTALLRPEARGYAPALGLLLFNNMPFVSNLRWATPATLGDGGGGGCDGLARACALAEELFFQRERDQPLALTRSRSRVGYYLTPALLGHVIGLGALSPALSDGELDNALRGLGVETNKIHGEKTGVSLARWRRIIRLSAPGPAPAAGGDGVGPQLATAVLLRLLWERASSKACLASFLTTLDGYIPVLQPGPALDALRPPTSAAEDGSWCEAWVSSGYSAEELRDQPALEAAATLLTATHPEAGAWEEWAAALDLTAAALSQVQVAKPRLTVRKYGVGDSPPMPDCVEVTCREIFDLLLYDPSVLTPLSCQSSLTRTITASHVRLGPSSC